MLAKRLWWILAVAFATLAAIASPSFIPELPSQAASMRPLLVSGLLWTRALLAASAIFALVCGWVLQWDARNRPTSIEPAAQSEIKRFGSVEVGVVIGLTLLALLMRLPNVGDELWWDELNSMVRVVRRGAFVIIAFVAGGNSHILNTWGMFFSSRLFGESEWALRLPALLLGTAMPAAAFLALRRLASRPFAILTGAALAIHFRMVVFSDEARGYIGTMLFAILASCLFVSLWRRFSLTNAWLYVLCCTLASGFLVTTLYIAVGHFFVVAVAAALAWRRKDWTAIHDRIPLLVAIAWAGILSVMVNVFTLPQVLSYYDQEASAAHQAMNWEVFGISLHYLSGMESVAAAAVMVSASVAGWYLLSRSRNGVDLFLGVAAPALFQMLAFTLQRTKVSPRLFVLMIFPLVVGVAFLFTWLWQRLPLQKAAAALLGLVLIAGAVPAFQRFYGIGNPDLRRLASQLPDRDRLLLAGAQGDMNVFYFPGAPWVLEGATMQAVESRNPRYALLGEDCRKERFAEAMTKSGFRRVERLADWTAPELSRSQRRPCFVLYERETSGVLANHK
jgi:hypothetical protein